MATNHEPPKHHKSTETGLRAPSITTPDDDCTSELLVSAIQSYLDKRLAKYHHIASDAAYIEAAQTFPDEAMSCLKQLMMCDIQKNRSLWLYSVGELVRSALVLIVYVNSIPELTTQLSSATTMMIPCFSELCLSLETLAKEWDVGTMPHSAALAERQYQYFYRTLALACEWFTKGPDLVHEKFTLCAIASRLSRDYEEQLPKAQFSTQQAEAFPALVQLARACYICAYPEIALELTSDEKGEPCASVARASSLLLHTKLEFSDLIDFCRYFGYCLVTYVASSPSIDQKVSNRADVFLSTLLGLPNLRLSHYAVMPNSLVPEPSVSDPPKRYISVREREELSLFYIVNSIFRMTFLTQFVSPSHQFRGECKFLLASLRSKVSLDLDVLASAPQSRSASIASLPVFELQALSTIPTRKLKTMSSILTEGTYKEKINIVLAFVRYFVINGAGNNTRAGDLLVDFVQIFSSALAPGENLPTMFAHDDVKYLIQKINKSDYPGKILFVEAMRKIVLLSQLLFVKHIYSTTGIRCGAQTLVQQVFQTQTPFDDILNVKALIQLNNDGQVQLYSLPRPLEEEKIEDHLRHLEQVRLLEEQC